MQNAQLADKIGEEYEAIVGTAGTARCNGIVC